MKPWQTILIILSIFLAAVPLAIYIKYKPKNILTNEGATVDLGEVFSERVFIKLTFYVGDMEHHIGEMNFSKNTAPIHMAFSKLIDSWIVKTKDVGINIRYENMKPSKGIAKLKIETFIEYKSSNFPHQPYVLNLRSETYPIPGGQSLKESVEVIMNDNYLQTKHKAINYLYITDPSTF